MWLKASNSTQSNDNNFDQTPPAGRRCSRCLAHISDRFLLKISKAYYHERCAVCSVCQRSFALFDYGSDSRQKDSNETVGSCGVCFEREGALYCRMHFDLIDLSSNTTTLTATMDNQNQQQQQQQQLIPHECAGCKVPISSTDMVYKLKLGIVYHVKCHVCFKCGKQLTPGERIIVYEATKSVACISHYPSGEDSSDAASPNENSAMAPSAESIDGSSPSAAIDKNIAVVIDANATESPDRRGCAEASGDSEPPGPDMDAESTECAPILVTSGAAATGNTEEFIAQGSTQSLPPQISMEAQRQPISSADVPIFHAAAAAPTLFPQIVDDDYRVTHSSKAGGAKPHIYSFIPTHTEVAGEENSILKSMALINEGANMNTSGIKSISLLSGVENDPMMSDSILTYATAVAAGPGTSSASDAVFSVASRYTKSLARSSASTVFMDPLTGSCGENFTQLLNSSYLNPVSSYLGSDLMPFPTLGCTFGEFLTGSHDTTIGAPKFIGAAGDMTSNLGTATGLSSFLPPLHVSCFGVDPPAVNSAGGFPGIVGGGAMNSMLFLPDHHQDQQRHAVVLNQQHNPATDSTGYDFGQDAFLRNLMSAKNDVSGSFLSCPGPNDMRSLCGLPADTFLSPSVSLDSAKLKMEPLKVQRSVSRLRNSAISALPHSAISGPAAGSTASPKPPIKRSRQRKPAASTVTAAAAPPSCTQTDEIGIDKVLKDRLKKFGIFRGASPAAPVVSSASSAVVRYQQPFPTNNEQQQLLHLQVLQQQQQSQQNISDNNLMPFSSSEMSNAATALSIYSPTMPAPATMPQVYGGASAAVVAAAAATMYGTGITGSDFGDVTSIFGADTHLPSLDAVGDAALKSSRDKVTAAAAAAAGSKYPFEMYTFGELYAEADADAARFLKRRGPRTSIKQEQLDLLNKIFVSSPKPSKHARAKLAVQTGLNMRVIQVWFQNRRSKERRLKHLCNFLRHCERRNSTANAGGAIAGDEEEARLFAQLEREMFAVGDGAPPDSEFSDYLELKMKEKFAGACEPKRENLAPNEPDYTVPDSTVLLDDVQPPTASSSYCEMLANNIVYPLQYGEDVISNCYDASNHLNCIN